MYILIVIGSVLIASFAQILFKSSSGTLYSSFWREYVNIKVIIGYTLMLLSLLINIYALGKGVKVKEVSSIETISYMFVPFLSFIFFQEKTSRNKIISIIFIIIGVLIFFK